ncbi:Phosphatidylinositol-4-phosphate 5-kinase [Chytridiales sp. JEL 0842]|nr:Phosphatidylinositol-4-phosphate 5-kinase [Chytridiales sp. JEL 0842]
MLSSDSMTDAQASFETKEICRYFQRHGTCRFGDDCRYSHNMLGRVGLDVQPRRPNSSRHQQNIDPSLEESSRNANEEKPVPTTDSPINQLTAAVAQVSLNSKVTTKEIELKGSSNEGRGGQRRNERNSNNNARKDRNKNRRKNTESFEPMTKPVDMRVALDLGKDKLTTPLTSRDVLLAPNLFTDFKPGEIYRRLVDEIEHCGVPHERLFKLWHGDSHTIADDHAPWKKHSPTFHLVVDRLRQFFNMDIKATRFNLYKSTADWKPFHFDAAAVKPEKAATQNFTIAVSFGATRDAAFEDAETKTVIKSTPKDHQPIPCDHIDPAPIDIEIKPDPIPKARPDLVDDFEEDELDTSFVGPGYKPNRLSTTSSWTNRRAIGTPVKEGHSNYMLMFDMLTGIRVSVSRCIAKPPRRLEDTDFTAAHKLAFDVSGNELTPSASYDFKFKDYSPWVFRGIREIFKIDPSDYLISLTGKYVLSELGSPGKSGSFFYFSRDYNYIIKTIHTSEFRFLRSILKDYYQHVKENPQTLLCRIFGLHRVKLPGKKKIHFVVMGNVFPSNKDIHETYDLKGSTVGRLTRDDGPSAVMKDLNWLEKERTLHLGPQKRAMFLHQVTKDVKFLKRMQIMDYSLLIGVHDLVKGNKENIRDATLAVFEPNAETLSRRKEKVPSRRSSKSSAMRRALSDHDPVQLSASQASLPEHLPPERMSFFFYQDMGGVMASDEQDLPKKEVYFIGIIDILTKYNAAKKIEHFFKSVTQNATQISAVSPDVYASRFEEFLQKHVLKSPIPAVDR